MTTTLNDYFKQSRDPIQKGLMADLLRYSDLMKMVPIEDIEGLRISATRWQTMPSVAFRKYGAGYTESTGTVENFTETLAILGGDVKVDRLANKGTFIEDPLVTQMQMKAKALAFKFNDTIINGDHATDADSFEGLKKRVSNMPSRQTIDLASSGDALKVLASSGNEHTFLDALHEAIKKVDGATAFLCNEATYLGLGKVLRRLGLLETRTDAYGNKWDSFSGVPLVDVGLKSDKSTEIITSTEDPGDGGNDGTSIYVARFDTDDGVRAIQLKGTKGPNVYDPLNGGEMEAGPQYLRRIDWPLGLFHKSQYSIARIKGFKMAAS